MKLFTKLKDEFSSKINNVEKSKKGINKAKKEEWLLSDEKFTSILYSSPSEEKDDNSKIKEFFSDNEEMETKE